MAKTAEIIDITNRLPTRDEIENAAEVASILANSRTKSGAIEIPSESVKQLFLAPSLSNLIIELLGLIARGDMVTLVPYSANLTTQQAADILNISRAHLSELLEDKKIEFEIERTHRKVNLESLLNYKIKVDKVQQKALDELARLGQEADAS